jgi:prevent-host-death family protein
LGVKINVEQAKAQLDSLIDRSAAGEEVVITRDGRPIVKIVAVPATNGHGANGLAHSAEPDAEPPPQRLGWAKDIITYIAPDFDEPLEEFREYME